MIAQVAELHDGGYWYVVPSVVVDDGTGPVTVPHGVDGSMAAWYSGGDAVVRAIAPQVVAEHGSTITSKPYARIGGA